MAAPPEPEPDEVASEAATEPIPPAARPPRLWLWLAVAAIVYAIGSLIPLPGIDREAMVELANRGGMSGGPGAGIPVVSVFGVGIGAMVFIHVVLIVWDKLNRPLARRVGLAVWLAIAAVQAFLLALFLESLGGAAPFLDIVYEPGYGFRLTTTVTFVAGAAVLWFLASQIDRTERAYGALFLWLLATAATFAGQVSSTGELVRWAAITPLAALASLAWPAAGVALGVLMILRPRTWPIPLFGSVQLRSGWDVLGLTVLGTLPSAIAASTVDAGVWVGTSFLFVLVAGFAFFWLRLAPGDEPARAWGPAIAAAGYFVLCAVVLIGSAVSSGSAGGLASNFSPGPLHGDNRFALELVTEDRFGDGDAERLTNRLERLGADVTVEEQTSRAILLRIEASSAEAVQEVLRPRRLRFSLAHDFSTDPFLGALEPRTSSRGLRAFSGSCEQVALEITNAAREPVEDADCDWLLERDSERCVTYCVERAAVVTQLDVAGASTTADPYSGVPAVMVTLTDDAAERFESFTGQHTTQVLAIVVDDQILSAPVIQQAIPGGQVQVMMDPGLGPDVGLGEARALAAALDGPSVAVPYEISRRLTWSELDSD